MRYISAEKLDSTGLVKTMFTLMGEGGFGYDNPEHIDNYRRVAETLGITTDKMIRLQQTHSSGVRIVTLANGGEGVMREETVHENDGMITDEKGLAICTVEADCVPVLLLDPIRKVIANVHSGWRGTAAEIAANAVNKMRSEFKCNPSDILCCIGPHNCGECYEITEEIIPEFKYHDTEKIITKKQDGKYYLNMSEAVKMSLIKTGVLPENIDDMNICTFEDDRFSSWRRDKDKDGRILSVIMLT